jgi:hypothetical protein
MTMRLKDPGRSPFRRHLGRTGLAVAAAVIASVGWTPTVSALEYGPDGEVVEPEFGRGETRGPYTLDGEFVHNVGEIQLHMTNWGLIGSLPGVNCSFCDAPSAMWPAGSGVDYLFEAALWVGALKNSVPVVTTGRRGGTELRANPNDPLDTIWVSQQGAPGGARYPDPNFDDDGDGLENEDPLNGLDDDEDGLIDEDFAAISNQHFRTVLRDDDPLAIEANPDHEPLNIRVIQESFAWENDNVDDFIGFEFTIIPTENFSVDLQDVYVGFFADCDIGPRGTGGIAQDDMPGFFDGRVRAIDRSLVPISVAYMYDQDADGGQADGYIGIMFLDHPIDPLGVEAPVKVGITSFQQFAGNQPFDRGGDPGNDAERYELLSRFEFDPFPSPDEESKANDYRILISTGPFSGLAQGEELEFQMGMVIGSGLAGLQRNAAEAALTYYGNWFDRDLDEETGVQGRETRVCQDDFEDPNEIFDLFFSPCDTSGLGPDDEFPPPVSEEDLDEDGCFYQNADCEVERRRDALNCDQDDQFEESELAGCTGVKGKEFHVTWLVGLAPQPPGLRLVPSDNQVHVFWSNVSEVVPDIRLQEVDFESYLVWRAEGWERPFGSSIENGPESELWSLVAEFDKVNFFEDRRFIGDEVISQRLPLGANTGLDVISYTPRMYRPGTPEYDRHAPVRDLVSRIVEDPEFQSLLGPTINPATFLRYIDPKTGNVSAIGRKYPELARYQDNYAPADTAYFVEIGLDFYEYVDRDVFNGHAYFYAVTASDFRADSSGEEGLLPLGPGLAGDAQSNFAFAVPKAQAQTKDERDERGQDIYVVPNPATRESLAEFSQFSPNADDPTGVRVMFANLPRARNTIKIYTLAGDLVQTIEHDGTAFGEVGSEGFSNTGGSAFWNLVSRNGQEIVSGVYLYSVESSDPDFERVVGRFVVVR